MEAKVLEMLGNNIRLMRKRRGYTIKKLATETGLNAKYIQRVETGRNNISVVNLDKIAKSLSIQIDELFMDKNDKEHQDGARLNQINNSNAQILYALLNTLKVTEDTENAHL